MSLLLIGMDVTIVNVATPAIRSSLGASFQSIEWVIDGYTLVIASLLMLTGSLSDRFGRKRLFLLGLTLFTAGSLLCALAANVEMLIACRLLQGLGASMLNPVALSIVSHSFPDPKAKARAVGVWSAVFGIALGLGPIVGGFLTETAGWRAIFIINVPVGLAALALTAWFIPESKAARSRSFDPVGQLLMMTTLATLTYAVIEGQQLGWQSAVVRVLLIMCVVSTVALVIVEQRLAEPFLDVRFFRSVPFSSATLIAVIYFSCFAAMLFWNALYLQQDRGFSALQAGLCTLPLAVMTMLCGMVSGRMVGHYGTRPSLCLAGIALMGSMLLLNGVEHDSAIVPLLLAYGMFGAGLGMVNPAIATVAISGMPRSQTGVAAAVASASRQVGASLGVAFTGTVVHAGQAHGEDIAQSTHVLWWVMCGLGGIVVLLSWLSNTQWAKEGSRRIAVLSGVQGE